MRRSLRAFVFDEVTGFQERVGSLSRDPETGLLTRYPDRPNPQKYLRPVGTDGVGRRPSRAPKEQLNVRCMVGLEGSIDDEGRRSVPALSVSADLACRYVVGGS
ncbi:MAG: hypothetical protein ABL908_07975 [Hyphomicrobium sp.]